MTDKYTLIFKKSGCKYYEQKSKWKGKCKIDNSYRRFRCFELCPKCKPLLKDRVKGAWHILKWNRRYIQNDR